MQTRAPIPSSSRQGMTILEVMIALSVLALLLSGILAALLQAHRMTQESIYGRFKDQFEGWFDIRSSWKH